MPTRYRFTDADRAKAKRIPRGQGRREDKCTCDAYKFPHRKGSNCPPGDTSCWMCGGWEVVAYNGGQDERPCSECYENNRPED